MSCALRLLAEYSWQLIPCPPGNPYKALGLWQRHSHRPTHTQKARNWFRWMHSSWVAAWSRLTLWVASFLLNLIHIRWGRCLSRFAQFMLVHFRSDSTVEVGEPDIVVLLDGSLHFDSASCCLSNEIFSPSFWRWVFILKHLISEFWISDPVGQLRATKCRGWFS